MQLDFLQDEVIPAKNDVQSAPSKKAKHSSKQPKITPPDLLAVEPAKVEEVLVELPLKPLPVSLQPQFLIKQFEDSMRPVQATLGAEMVTDKLPAKNPDAFKTISEAAKVLGVPQHVLRFWESRFAQIKPLKLAGGRRYYRPEDMDVLTTIHNLLYKQGYTIKGAKKAIVARKAPHAQQSVDIFTQAIPAFPEVKAREFSEKQIRQLSAIRQELIGLKDALTHRIY